MNETNFANNILRLRHNKNITQEQLADFIGITKASISKWENNQSMPDIMLLPQLATFFNVTIDELIGYEPQLSKEQIQKIYQELSLKFSTLSFEETLTQCYDLIKRYYSCYPFLLQICILLLNHFMLTEELTKQQEILNRINDICEHIIKNCPIVKIYNETISLKAMICLQLGKTAEVIEALEDLIDLKSLSNQSDTILIQAYQMNGDIKKAKSCTQISMYTHLLSLIGSAIQYLNINSADINICIETIYRINELLKLYNIDTLHPNIAAQFHYQCALIYINHKMNDETLLSLQQYGKNVEFLLTEDNLNLHGDSYFKYLDEWISKLDLGSAPPRNKKIIIENFVQSLEHPLFEDLKNTLVYKELLKIKEHLQRS